MKSAYFTCILLAAGLALQAQIQTPSVVQEDTFSQFYYGGLWLDTPQGYGMITRKSGLGIGYVRFGPAFSVISERYTGASISVDDAFRAADGGIMISGHKVNPDNTRMVSLMKLDSAGRFQWQGYSSLVGTLNFGKGAAQVAPDTFVATGRRLAIGLYDAVTLSKFNATGNLVFDREYKTNGLAHGIDVETASAGEYLILAQLAPPDTTSPSIWLIRTSTSGDSLGSTYLGNHYDQGHSLLKAADGNFFVVTTENWWLPASLIRQTIRIHKITPGGSLIWSQRYVYQDDETRFTGLRAVRGRATADGGCVVVGNITGTAADSAYSNLYLLKVAPDGARQWELLLGTPDEDEASDVLQLPGGGYLVSATAWAYPAQGTPVPYMYAAQLSADGTATRIRQPDPALAVAVQPNPFGARLALRLSMEQPAPVQAELLDLQGRIVRTIRRPAASGQHLEFDTESLPAGAYLLRVHAGGKTWSSTVVRQ